MTSLEGWLEDRLRVLLGPGMAPRLGCKDEEEEGRGAGIELSLTWVDSVQILTRLVF